MSSGQCFSHDKKNRCYANMKRVTKNDALKHSDGFRWQKICLPPSARACLRQPRLAIRLGRDELPQTVHVVAVVRVPHLGLGLELGHQTVDLAAAEAVETKVGNRGSEKQSRCECRLLSNDANATIRSRKQCPRSKSASTTGPRRVSTHL